MSDVRFIDDKRSAALSIRFAQLRRDKQESGYSCIAPGWWNDKRLCTTSDSINSQNSWWNTPFA